VAGGAGLVEHLAVLGVGRRRQTCREDEKENGAGNGARD
jgi:hypothetical protein